MSDAQFRELLSAVAGRTPPDAGAPAPAVAPPREVTIDDFIAEADRPAVDHLVREWGEVHKGVEVMQRAALQHLQHSIYTQLNEVLAPMSGAIRTLQVMGHFNTIRQAHGDYDTVLPQVREWVDSQPKAVKDSLAPVLDKGNANQIIELVAAYKQAKALTEAAPAPAPSSAQPSAPAPTITAAAAAATPPAPSAAAVAATAAVVTGSRTAPAETRDPNDFGGALAEALSS